MFACKNWMEAESASKDKLECLPSREPHATRRSALVAPSAPSLVRREPNATLAVTSPTESASAAVAASVGIGIIKGQAGRDTHGRLVTTAISGQAARSSRRGRATHEDPHLGTGVQHHRRRRRVANPMLATRRECPRHTAVPPLRAACGRARLHSIRGSALLIWAIHGISAPTSAAVLDVTSAPTSAGATLAASVSGGAAQLIEAP